MSSILEKIEKVYDMFESSFIYKEDELIIHKKWNVYFRLPDITTPEEFDYKLLSYSLFYTASHHFDKNSKECKYFWNRLNRWFKKEFPYDDLQKMYQILGNGANKLLGIEFIKNDLNMSLLARNT
ncbi:MAG: hypothetical protein OEV44_02935, partial [Spirochaetota bacterium]|nr:hypothetical protein [Spirochaetota bacterium]